MSSEQSYDAIVIGGGHAGTEAGRVLARSGLSVALVTMLPDAIGRMSCNPAIGGLAKGNLVKEIDALGGLMGEATDEAGIQFRILNRSKGPAVQGPRAQCDRDLYAAAVQQILRREPLISIVAGHVKALNVHNDAVEGVQLHDGRSLRSRAVIITTGTFLRALMHSGETRTAGGRFGEPSAETLSDSLRNLGLVLGRLKTGTPPRVEKNSVDFSRMEPQPGDERPRPFSILTDRLVQPQVLCHLTYTSPASHELIRRNLHRAPMYSGQISAVGPRYCPSIEDKVVRFADKERHHVFVEPEGLQHPWLYLNGVSTSLPAEIQDAVVRSLPGFENSVIARYGYAVEYDFVNPEQLETSLRVRGVRGLYLAGQINGTSGYEEAAAQGLIAGINAAQEMLDREPLIVRRDQAYLGVMIDDLVTQGTEEPYRMFTSRAEHRLLLGCDSVYERLSPIAERLGILDNERRTRIEQRAARMSRVRRLMQATELVPNRETIEWGSTFGLEFSGPTTLARLTQRPGFDVSQFADAARATGRLPEAVGAIEALGEEELDGVVNEFRYAGYLDKQAREAEAFRRDENLGIPLEFSYRVEGLSNELVEKLNLVRPASLGQAARIRGMTPAAISILRLHLRKGSTRGRVHSPAPAAV